MIARKGHAGETAKAGGAQKWRTVRTRRGLALRSPDGVLYHGTAAEVRAARLFPWERDGLAEALRLYRSCAESREDLRRIAADRRRDFIRQHNAAVAAKGARGCDREILVAACARYMEMCAGEFEHGWVDAGISATLEEMPDGCGFLTRHEREAMNTPLCDWCESLYVKRALQDGRAEGKGRRA